MGSELRERLRLSGVEQGRVLDAALALSLAFASLLGWMLVQRALLRELFTAPPWFAQLGPIAGVAVLPAFFKHGTHFIYDFPALFLAAALCLALARRSVLAWHALMALAALNKETAVIFVLLFALDARRWLPPKRMILHAGLSLLVCAVVRSAILWRFSANPGRVLEDHLSENLSAWMVPPQWFAIAACFATVAAVLRRFSQRPAMLRAGVCLFPVFLGLHLFFGFPGEIRVYYELVPVLFSLGYASWIEWMGTPVETAGEAEARGSSAARRGR